MKPFINKTMKALLAVLITGMIMTSCSKKEVTAPEQSASSAGIFYRDNNIAVSDMNSEQVNATTLDIHFATLYQNNIQTIEVMSGSSENQLCSIFSENVTSNSESVKKYTVTDSHLKGTTMYYMIRYSLTDGTWGYTPLLTVEIH